MADKTLKQIGEAMRDIDFCMLTTVSEGGLAGRPMSNNRDVEFDGDCYFFADGDSRTVRDLERDPTVALAFQGSGGLMGVVGKPGIFNTDQGAQFTSDEFTQMLRDHGIEISMDGRGRCHDNIFVERLWWTVKHEWVYLRPAADGIETWPGPQSATWKTSYTVHPSVSL